MTILKEIYQQRVRWAPHNSLPPEELDLHLTQYGQLSRWSRDVPCIIGNVTGLVDIYVWVDPATGMEFRSRMDVEIKQPTDMLPLYSFTIIEETAGGRSGMPVSIPDPVDVSWVLLIMMGQNTQGKIHVQGLTPEQFQALFPRVADVVYDDQN